MTRPAILVVDEIFHHHGDRCLDATRWHLAETLEQEMITNHHLSQELEEARRRCREWLWLWLGTCMLLVAAIAGLVLDIRL